MSWLKKLFQIMIIRIFILDLNEKKEKSYRVRFYLRPKNDQKNRTQLRVRFYFNSFLIVL